jgi:glyoxylase-like metal-dependent hydrolase (beta-lactamase superfamily II)/rhodanese-related sulfurtransferase
VRLLFEQLNPGCCLTYLVADGDTKQAALIDPVIDEVDGYLTLLKNQGLTLTHVIDTHTHADHISGCPKLMDLTGCAYVMYEKGQPKCITKRMKDGETLSVGQVAIRFVHTPGHTKDSVTLVLADRIISGDTLFLDDAGGGRSDLPGGDPADHWESLQIISRLPDHLLVFPGHEYRGRKPSTIAEQKNSNHYLKTGSKDAFTSDLKSLHLGAADWMKPVLQANAECTRDPQAVHIPKGVPACEVMGTAAGALPCDVVLAHIEPIDVKKRLDSGEELVLLDVRESHELRSEIGHMANIVHIPLGDLQDRVEELSASRDKVLISICRSGKRAATAANFLQESGFTNVLIMEGGMLRWREHGLPSATDN